MPGFEFFGDEERKEVNEVLDTGVLMRYGFDGMRKNHWKANEFEAAFAARMKSNHCQLVSSGTSALTVALASAGIGTGDEIIMPTFTFVASFESILMLGAIPVLVDIDDTLALDPQAVKNAITKKTKCIMPVHMCGSMADLKQLRAICDEYDLILLEDACQAIGGTFDNKPLGSYGDLGCFSFDYVKTITCGEGGGIITNNKQFAQNADQYQDHGHDHFGNDRGAEAHNNLGYNFRISELNAAVGVAQLKKLDAILSHQKKNYSFLKDSIKNIEGITFRKVPETGVENYSFLNIFLPSQEIAENAHKALVDSGVDACFYWFKNNWHYINGWEHLKNSKSLGNISSEIKEELDKLKHRDFSQSDFWMGRTISFLVKIGWSDAELKSRTENMKSVLNEILSKKHNQ